ncbi:hypothetical protein AGMMS49992_17550 [Clostridia bacterium]|nr:hypothetical protein AGMMS49992_17550 [Clostridia bacterium]
MRRLLPEYNASNRSRANSPLERYNNAPRANTLTPDWNSLAVFKVQKPIRKVQPDGVHYAKEIYWHPDLREIIGEYVSIYDFDQTFCHSITIIHNGKYVCEAEPLVHHATIERDRLWLAHHIEEQRSQARKLSRRVIRIRQVLNKSGVSTSRYIDYNPTNEDLQPEVLPAFGEEIDLQRDKEEATQLSATANEIGLAVRAQEDAIGRIINGVVETPFSAYLRNIGASMQVNHKSDSNANKESI